MGHTSKTDSGCAASADCVEGKFNLDSISQSYQAVKASIYGRLVRNGEVERNKRKWYEGDSLGAGQLERELEEGSGEGKMIHGYGNESGRANIMMMKYAISFTSELQRVC
jgi:hypothetical protein